MYMEASWQINTYSVNCSMKYLEITLIKYAGSLVFKMIYFSETIFRKEQASFAVGNSVYHFNWNQKTLSKQDAWHMLRHDKAKGSAYNRLLHTGSGLVTESCLTLGTPWTVACHALCPWYFPGKNTAVGCHFLLQGSSQPRDWTCISCVVGRFFTTEPSGKPFPRIVSPKPSYSPLLASIISSLCYGSLQLYRLLWTLESQGLCLVLFHLTSPTLPSIR